MSILSFPTTQPDVAVNSVGFSSFSRSLYVEWHVGGTNTAFEIDLAASLPDYTFAQLPQNIPTIFQQTDKRNRTFMPLNVTLNSWYWLGQPQMGQYYKADVGYGAIVNAFAPTLAGQPNNQNVTGVQVGLKSDPQANYPVLPFPAAAVGA